MHPVFFLPKHDLQAFQLGKHPHLLLPGRSLKRTVLALLLVLFGVFMMRWNVVIGGQAFSLSFAGYMHYEIPIIPHSIETFKEGVFGALMVITTPFVLFWVINKFVPSLRRDAEGR